MIDTADIYTSEVVAAEYAPAINGVKISLAGKTWSAMVIHVGIENIAADSKPGEALTVHYAPSVFDLPMSTAEEIAATIEILRASARNFTVPMPAAASQAQVSVSPVIGAIGNILYVWLSHEPWTNPRTVNMIAAGI